MATKIEFHLLQSFPPANLNRDDTNTPKDCEFGGVRRARISSQCLKRSIRLHPDFAAVTEVSPSDRTRWMARKLRDELVKRGRAPEEAEIVAVNFTKAFLGAMDKNNPLRSQVLFFLSDAEKEDLAAHLDAGWDAGWQVVVEGKDGRFDGIIKDYKKRFANRSSAPDIALFGRMLADDPSLNLDAACQVAHAISTHKVSMEMDFYTAVDDLQREDEAGAGMMGVTSFNAATFYRYAAIDWEQLLKNLDGDQDLARCTVQGFLRASVKAIPTGKQNAFAPQTLPGFVLVVVRKDGQAWSLVNAFEKPLNAARSKGGYLDASIQALVKHWERLNAVYGDSENPARAFALSLAEDLDLGSLKNGSSLKQLEEDTLAALLEV